MAANKKEEPRLFMMRDGQQARNGHCCLLRSISQYKQELIQMGAEAKEATALHIGRWTTGKGTSGPFGHTSKIRLDYTGRPSARLFS
eukprot:1162009-Pelagomonas_calceolata.AAC.3